MGSWRGAETLFSWQVKANKNVSLMGKALWGFKGKTRTGAERFVQIYRHVGRAVSVTNPGRR